MHSGYPSELALLPAPLNTGIVFRRTDLPGSPMIAADVEHLVLEKLQRRTTLRVGDARVFTIEHVLSALMGMGVSDAIVEMNAEEPPFLDGSSKPFVEMIQSAGVLPHGGTVRPLQLSDTVIFRDGGAEIVAIPSNSFRVTYFFTSDHPLLRTQSASYLLDDTQVYQQEIAPARTFCFFEEIEALQRAGLIKGANLSSAVVFGRKSIINEPLRFNDEPVRHKILDFIGDLALLGRPLKGHFLVWRGGHRANALFALHLKNTLSHI